MRASASAATNFNTSSYHALWRDVALMTAVVAVLLCFASYGGARASAVPGGDVPGGLTFGGLQRSYLVHVPAGLEQPAGLVINLHGAGVTEVAQAAMTNYNAVADQHGFVVVIPDGIDFSWADGRGASVPDRQGVDDVGFLVALADRLTQDFGIDRGRVFATGMSAGAFMANGWHARVLTSSPPSRRSPARSGSAFPCAPSQPVSVLEIHGTADNVVPFSGGPMVGRGGASDILAAPAMAQRWRELNGCPGPVEDVSGAEQCAGSRPPDALAAPRSRSFRSTVVVTRGPDASQASGQFFATHGR